MTSNPLDSTDSRSNPSNLLYQVIQLNQLTPQLKLSLAEAGNHLEMNTRRYYSQSQIGKT